MTELTEKTMEVEVTPENNFDSSSLPVKEKEQIKIEDGDIIKIFKGERPSHMDHEVFRQIRKVLKKTNEKYLRGSFSHGSNFVIEEKDGKQNVLYSNKGVTLKK